MWFLQRGEVTTAIENGTSFNWRQISPNDLPPHAMGSGAKPHRGYRECSIGGRFVEARSSSRHGIRSS